MPLYALVYSEVVCPHCKAFLRQGNDDPLQIQGGAIPDTYFIGETLRWISGSTWNRKWPSHNYFNRGDPTLSHVIILDESIVRHCRSCAYEPGAVGIEISDGILIRSVVFRKEFLSVLYWGLQHESATDVLIVSEDGSIRVLEYVPCDVDN